MLTQINVSQLHHFAACQRRIWLDHQVPDEPAQTNLPWQAGIELTRERIQAASGDIREARLEGLWQDQVLIRGVIERLELTKLDGKHLYRPIESQKRFPLRPSDYFRMDLYLWLLQQIQPQITSGIFWGDWVGTDNTYKREHHFDTAHFEEMMRQVVAVWSQHEAPDFTFGVHCKFCPWVSACWKQAGGKMSLHVLPDLRQDSIEALEAAQIRTIEDLSAISENRLLQIPGIGKNSAKQHLASAQAWSSGEAVWLGELPERVRIQGVMFDLETYQKGQKTIPWSWGLYSPKTSYVILLAPKMIPQHFQLSDQTHVVTVTNTTRAWEIIDELVRGLPLYHWTSYDANILKMTAPALLKKKLLSQCHDLHRTFKNCVKLPLRSASLKEVAPHLGFEWRVYDDYLQAYHDYKAWLETNDTHFLEQSCSYQMDDVKALHHVWDWMITHAPPSLPRLF